MKQNNHLSGCLAVVLSACVSLPPIDKENESRLLAQDRGVPHGRVKFTSRCDYAFAPKGAAVAREPRDGVCFVTDDGLSIRVLDVTTAKSQRFASYRFSEIESMSRVSYSGYEQFQVRLAEQILVVSIRPDAAVGVDWETSSKFFETLKAVGVKEVPTALAIRVIIPGLEGGGGGVPILIPRSR